MKSYKVLVCGVEKGRVSARNDAQARRKAAKMFPDFVGAITVMIEFNHYQYGSQRSPFGI